MNKFGHGNQTILDIGLGRIADLVIFQENKQYFFGLFHKFVLRLKKQYKIYLILNVQYF